MTPFWSIDAIAGVSLDHVMTVATSSPLASVRLAKSWSSNPTGSGGSSNGCRPEKAKLGGGGGGLHDPKVEVAGPYHPIASWRCNDLPIGVVPPSFTSMSVDVIPAAGPFVATNVPPYDRNSTTW